MVFHNENVSVPGSNLIQLIYLQFHALAFSRQTKLDSDQSEEQRSFRSKHLALLTEELQHAVCRYRIAAFPSAAVALALLSMEIENLSSDSSNWVSITSQLQAHADVRLCNFCRYIVYGEVVFNGCTLA